MRALLSTLIAFFFASAATATVYTVTVSSNQFSPSNLNVSVGDQVQFVWSNGFHTSTCDPNSLPGTSHPAGATPWDETMGNSSSNFTITISVAGTYIYGCQPHWPGMAGNITASMPTPVKLSEFIVSNSNNEPRLTWKTASEQNSDYFSIRRSSDGHTFTEISKVQAAGNSTLATSYSFTDKTVNKKDKYLYFSLGITDKDGKVEYSPIKMFKNPIAGTKLITSLSPNPIGKTGHLMLKFNADRKGTLYASLINAAGKRILQTEMAAFAGLNNGHFHLGGVAAGTYTALFKLDGITEAHKIVIK